MAEYPELKKLKSSRWKLRREILAIILLSLIAGGGSYTKPTLPLLVKAVIQYFKEEKKLNLKEGKIKKILEDFEEQEILDFQRKDDDIYVHYNENNSKVIRYSIKTLLEYKIKKKNFEGKWYMVFFDVPELQKNKRNQLRYFLEKLGFYRYQKSVYILPYNCEEEVRLIKKIVEGAKYMKYIIAERIEDETKVKTHFHLV